MFYRYPASTACILTPSEVSTGVAPASLWLRTKVTCLIVHETTKRGRRDLNSRPFARQATALDQLSYTPKCGKYSIVKVQDVNGLEGQAHYIYTTKALQDCQGHTTRFLILLMKAEGRVTAFGCITLYPLLKGLG